MGKLALFTNALDCLPHDPLGAYSKAVRESTGVDLHSTLGPINPYGRGVYNGFKKIALATMTVARIQDYWDEKGEPKRGDRVAAAFAHSMSLPEFWETIISYENRPHAVQEMIEGKERENPALELAPGNSLKNKYAFAATYAPDDPEFTIIMMIENAKSVDDLKEALAKHEDLITNESINGSIYFFTGLGGALSDAMQRIREEKSGEASILKKEWDFRIPMNNKRGAIIKFLYAAWFSHLYWLMPPGLLRDARLVDATEQQTKDLSRYKFGRASKPAITHVREGQAPPEEPAFRFSKEWKNGPEVYPGDYPRES